ncbi:MAG: hypothetical protein ACM3ZT_03655 [Bacillota bacterium]
MARRFAWSFSAAVLAALAAACGKAPNPPTAPAAPAKPAAPAPTAAVTYQCSSPQKSRDLFMRFGPDGALYLGDNATDMKPTGDMILFDKSGVANWTDKLPNGSETNRFDKNTGEWIWEMDTRSGESFDQARYSCKPV